MSEINNADSNTTINDQSIQSGIDRVDGGTLSVEYDNSGVLISEEDNLTISTLDEESDLVAADNSEGVESPNTTENESNETQPAVTSTDQTANEEEVNDDDGSGDDDSGDTESTLAAEDIALSASSVLTNALLIAADSSDSELSPVQEILNRFMRSDSGDDIGEPAYGLGLADGTIGFDFDSDISTWNVPRDGLTESFAAAAARMNHDASGTGGHVSLGTVQGKSLIEA